MLSLIVFLPALGALVLAFFPREQEEPMKVFSLAVTVAVFALTLLMIFSQQQRLAVQSGRRPTCRKAFSLPWIPSFNINYFMGLDGISFPLVVLTAFVSMLSMAASWPITKHVKAYCILFLLLETGMLGVFMALDFFLFYVFWEVMLLPMYFLIGVWGGPRREYAAIKFFLYTLLGSVFMLIAILMLYFNSDLRPLNDDQLMATHAADEILSANGLTVSSAAGGAGVGRGEDARVNQPGPHVQHPGAAGNGPAHRPVRTPMLFGKTLQWWAFVLLFVGFAIKVPSVPLHTWLPDAHVEAPTPISMILAGVLLEDGRLRHHPHLLSDLSGRRLRSGLRRLRHRRGEHGLRGVRRVGPERLQAARGL